MAWCNLLKQAFQNKNLSHASHMPKLQMQQDLFAQVATQHGMQTAACMT